MIKVSDIVRDVVESSEIASASLGSRLLNYSAYAEQIREEVERRAMKPVKKGTIVVALSRIAKKGINFEELIPKIIIDDLTVKTPLAEVTVSKTKNNFMALRHIYEGSSLNTDEFMTVTQGVGEITIVCTEGLKEAILELFNKEDVITVISNLVALSVKFNKDYISQPNVIYAILRTVALEKINIIEVVSTYSELTFIIEKRDLQKAFSRINQVYQR